jgi:hypothetical protein
VPVQEVQWAPQSSGFADWTARYLNQSCGGPIEVCRVGVRRFYRLGLCQLRASGNNLALADEQKADLAQCLASQAEEGLVGKRKYRVMIAFGRGTMTPAEAVVRGAEFFEPCYECMLNVNKVLEDFSVRFECIVVGDCIDSFQVRWYAEGEFKQ